MMTMATSTVDSTTSWCLPSSLTFSGSSLCSFVSHPSKSEACDNKRQSLCNLSSLREIPTRNFRQDPADAAVDHIDDGVDALTNRTLPPPTRDGDNATFSYKSELTAITAEIDRMRQRDAELERLHPSMTQPPPALTMPPPASPAATATTVNVMPTAPMSTTTFPSTTPASTIAVAPDDDGTHTQDARGQPSSITAIFIAQAQMLRTINLLLVELDGLVDKLVDDPPRFATRPPLPNSLYDLIRPMPYPTICLTTAILPLDRFPSSQIPPWQSPNADSGTPFAPAPKISPYKRHIPAKPPFPGGHGRSRRMRVMPQTKDRLRPP